MGSIADDQRPRTAAKPTRTEEDKKMVGMTTTGESRLGMFPVTPSAAAEDEVCADPLPDAEEPDAEEPDAEEPDDAEEPEEPEEPEPDMVGL